MPFTYCTECGYKNTFTTRKAKFCAGCGQSLLEEEATSKANSTRLRSAQANFQQEDDSGGGIPDIQKLEYTVDRVDKSPTIGDLINTKNEGGQRPKKKAIGSSKALSLEEFEAESMQECASSVNRSTGHGKT